MALNFIKQLLDEKFLCNVEKATTSKEAWKILEAEFGRRGNNEVEYIIVLQPFVAILEDEIESGYVAVDI